jgi:hypothetical protein
MGGRTIFLDEMGELAIVNYKELVEPGHTKYAGGQRDDRDPVLLRSVEVFSRLLVKKDLLRCT